MEQKRVLVGLSGGVDSSVTALLLQRAGYEVIGAFIRTWHPDFVRCTEEQDRLDAMRVAAHLGIPFITIDARKEYEEGVAKEMIAEYRKGRTPNPDMLCNRVVKFAVMDRVRKEIGAAYMATGHYAKIEHEPSESMLLRAKDASKDQSYFLANIESSVLPHVLFPLGDLLKSEVREIAQKAGLPSAQRKDSQGICFLGEIDIRTFLGHYIDFEPGVLLDEHGTEIGRHDGAALYTMGERHGFLTHVRNETATPRYVVGKDMEKNTVTVSTEHPKFEAGTTFALSSWNPIAKNVPDGAYSAVLRYHANSVPLTLEQVGEQYRVHLDGVTDRPSPGQTCVIYKDNRVVASGIIE